MTTTVGTARDAIGVAGLDVVRRDGTVVLDDVSLQVPYGRLTAVIGPSGAGKTTLLHAIAGLVPHTGRVRVELPEERAGAGVGFVPQDDVLHLGLPLRRTLRYAAALRVSPAEVDVDGAVEQVLRTLGLSAHAEQAVGTLSGGQRKRASIAAELLADPAVLLLDEPTSGLDPATAADVVDHLRRLSRRGRTVVFTTHSVDDVGRSDQVLALAPSGRVVAQGSPSQVLESTGASSFPDLYSRLGRVPRTERRGGPRGTSTRTASTTRASRPQQLLVLTRRSAELLVRNRLTLAILLGSPAAVIAMFAVLFRPHAFSESATCAVQIAYWMAFAAFFFGLTFGLLQVASEVPVLRREHHSGVRVSAYLLSKIVLLVPVLVLVNAVMVVVLQALDRIPALSVRTAVELLVTLDLDALAGLALGLLASAVVSSTAQAALALPMLCFPAVLFAGAMVPVDAMAPAGRGIAATMSDRWAFEAVVRVLDVPPLAAGGPYAHVGAQPLWTCWSLLGASCLLFLVAGWFAVRRRATSG